MRGVTLIELVVVLSILAVMGGIAGAALLGFRPAAAEPWEAEVARARATAIRTGGAVVVQGSSGDRALLLPDGRAIGTGLDALTGEVRR